MAAWQLTQRGCDVVVLEARDRVGGRVWSQELIPGDPRTVIERGAEFVLDGYDVLRETLGELGLELADTVMSYYEREPRGGGPATAAQVGECAAWVAEAAAAVAPGTTLAEVAAGWAGEPAALAAYIARMETTSGMSAGQLSRRWRRTRPPGSAGGQAGGWPAATSRWPPAWPGGSAQRCGWPARSAPCSRTRTGCT